MTDEAKELAQVKKYVRSILITFKNGCLVKTLDLHYQRLIGKRIPYQRFGYSDLENFLKNLPDTVTLKSGDHGRICNVVVDENTQHIEKLVSKQQNRQKKNHPIEKLFSKQNDHPSKSSKSPRVDGVYRPSYWGSASTPVTNSSQSNSRQKSKQFEKYEVPPRLRGRSSRIDKVKEVPCNERLHIKDLMNSYSNGLRIENFRRAYYQKFGVEFIPENYGFLDLKECLGSLENTGVLKLTHDNDSCLAYSSEDSTLRNTSQAPSSTTESVGVCENLVDVSEPCKSTLPPASSRENSTVSESLKTNLRQILAKFPDGLLLHKLLTEYEKLLKKTLNCNDYGFNNVLELVGELHDVFYMERPRSGGDWLLFDASKPPPPKAPKAEVVQCKPAPQLHVSPTKISAKIKANIETVLLGHADGIRLEQFEAIYMRNCNEALPWEELGYESITQFFLTLPEESCVQLYPCNSGTVLVVYEPKKPNAGVNEYIPFDPVLPGVDFEYPIVSVESCGDDYIRVFVTQVNNPGDIWIQFRQTTEDLELLMAHMEEMYTRDDAKQYAIPDRYLKESMVCAVVYHECGSWHRGKITAILSSNTVEVLFVDYGTVCKVDRGTLRFLRRNFLQLPAQAFNGRLANLKPIRNQWSKEARALLLDMCNDRPILAKITSTTYLNTVSVVLAEPSGISLIHYQTVLLSSNLAQYSQDDGSELLLTPNSFLEAQKNALSPSIGLSELLHQVKRSAYMTQLAASQIQHVFSGTPNSEMNTLSSIPAPEDNGFDASVINRMIAMGAAKPVEVDAKGSTMNIPASPDSVYYSSPSSLDSVAEWLSKQSFDAECSTEENGLISDVIKVAPEEHERKQCKYCQLISVNDYDIHLINYNGMPYMTSGDISLMIWGIDVLKKLMNLRKMNDPSITVFKSDADDFFKELEENDVKVLPDGVSVDLFPLESVKEIVFAFHKNGDDIILQLQLMEKCFNPLDPYWMTELKGDVGTIEVEKEDLQTKFHTLVQKKLKLLQKMMEKPVGDTVTIIQLLDVDEQIQRVEEDIKVKVPKIDIKKPTDPQEPAVNPMPVLNQNSVTHHITPIRQVQYVRPIVNQANTPVPLAPQVNPSVNQLHVNSVVSSPICPPPGMNYQHTIPYQIQQDANAPQNVSRNPRSQTF